MQIWYTSNELQQRHTASRGFSTKAELLY